MTGASWVCVGLVLRALPSVRPSFFIRGPTCAGSCLPYLLLSWPLPLRPHACAVFSLHGAGFISLCRVMPSDHTRPRAPLSPFAWSFPCRGLGSPSPPACPPPCTMASVFSAASRASHPWPRSRARPLFAQRGVACVLMVDSFPTFTVGSYYPAPITFASRRDSDANVDLRPISCSCMPSCQLIADVFVGFFFLPEVDWDPTCPNLRRIIGTRLYRTDARSPFCFSLVNVSTSRRFGPGLAGPSYRDPAQRRFFTGLIPHLRSNHAITPIRPTALDPPVRSLPP